MFESPSGKQATRRQSPSERRLPGHWALRAGVLGVGLAVLGVVTAKSVENAAVSRTSTTIGTTVELLALPNPKPAPDQQAAGQPVGGLEAPPWERITVQPGDSLAVIFSRAGISAQTLHAILQLSDETKALRKIFPGDEIRYRLDEVGDLLALEYNPNETRTLRVDRDAGSYRAQTTEHRLERRPVYRSGVIEDSLFQAAQSGGISDSTVMELASIFGWDIDFALDIREGDRFTVIYDEIYKDGQKIADGDILAAEFYNQGRRFRAIRYTDPSGKTGYFTPDGKNVKKAFLRSPVKFSRISSRFSLKRWHPILHRWRSHRGVDYSAPTGTPIKAAGDGKVSFRGTKGGYGRVVMLQHGSSYTTVYGHLSRFARAAKTGRKVKQGEVIGYVGKSGLATGPHLHYEFRVNGVHRNPLTVKLPDGNPVNSKYWDHFRSKTTAMAETLDLLDRTFLALNDS